MNPFRRQFLAQAGFSTVFVLSSAPSGQAAETELLNVSYDTTRAFYKAYNAAFAVKWKTEAGDTVFVEQSHGGSGNQARAVIEGLPADVVTLALAYDVDAIAEKGLIAKDWARRLPNNSAPYTSTIVFLVKKGNPWKVKDFGDLVKPGIEVVAPNPKTSGGARWAYLAAWAWAKHQPGGSDEKAKGFVATLYNHGTVFDSGARNATTAFTERGTGDVLLTWENEAWLSLNEFGADAFEIVFPPFSILAEAPVALVDKNVDRRKTRKLAEAYLNYLYSDEAQDLAARNYFRPRNPIVAAKYKAYFPAIQFTTIDAEFGGWANAQKTHFANGAIFDQIYQPRH